MIKTKWIGHEEWERAEEEWKNDVVDNVLSEVAKTAIKIERDAKLTVPVDTGNLRGSLETDIDRDNTSIETETGTDVEYAPIVEFGAINQRAQPYLIPSFDRNVKILENSIDSILRG